MPPLFRACSGLGSHSSQGHGVGHSQVRLDPVGTGPFTLATWQQNQIIVLEKNPHYCEPGLPYLDRLELRIMKDGVTRVTARRAGEVDFPNLVPREHLERLSRDPQLYVLRGKDTQRIATFFNLRKEAFQDVRVRRAVLGYGIDRPAIIKTAFMQAARDSMKGYVYECGLKTRFERTWLDKPQG